MSDRARSKRKRKRPRPEPSNTATPAAGYRPHTGIRSLLPSEPQAATPGTLQIPDGPPPSIHVIDYCPDTVHEKQLESVEEVVPYLEDEIDSITWVDVRGIHDRATFERLGEIFGIHPLALEDVVNVPQRPHADAYPDQQVVIARMVTLGELRGDVQTEQLAILFGEGFVLTVQEDADRDCLDVVRERIRRGRGPIRRSGADYLAYALLDAVIDGFFPVLEQFGERLEDLELEVSRARRSLSQDIHDLKRELLTVRRAIWPQRDLINSLLRDESPHVKPETRIYLRDTYDHAVQVMDMTETFREIASGLMDLYFSGLSTRMNEVMRVLTIISTIFLPITFIAGVYGMNFDPDASPYNMPELRMQWGYPLSLGLMAASVIGLLIYYGRKGWLRRGDR